MMSKLRFLAVMALFCAPSFSAEMISPADSKLLDSKTRFGTIALPASPATNGIVKSETYEGNIFQEARSLSGTSVKSLMDEFISSYESVAFNLGFRCASQACGGFNFRFAIETPGPKRFRVNLDNFEYAQMRSEDAVLSLLVSESDGVIYYQQTQVVIAQNTPVEMESVDLSSALAASTERVVLSSITFKLGSSEIETFEDAELAAVTERLKANSRLTLYLVGHSDQIGGLSANLAISRARAASVRTKLIRDFGAPSARVLSDGVGFLAPIADNRTEEGRKMNRRVEAVFLDNN